MKEEMVFGRNSILSLFESSNIPRRILVQNGNTKGSLKKILALAKDANVEIRYMDRKKLDSITENGNHQGVVAYVGGYEYADFDDFLQSGIKGFVLILDGIEDPHNLGAICRTAEAAGVDIILIPERRACGINETVRKVSQGATEFLRIAKIVNINNTIKKLKNHGYWIYGADMDGVPYDKEKMTRPIALVIGGEGKGISRLVKENLDVTISIPMKGKISSLNASVAAGILMYEILRQENG